MLFFLHSDDFLRKMNYTHIVLISKKNEPMYMADFRLISLENVISKIVSKVMVNRLKFILPNVIFDNQCFCA